MAGSVVPRGDRSGLGFGRPRHPFAETCCVSAADPLPIAAANPQPASHLPRKSTRRHDAAAVASGRKEFEIPLGPGLSRLAGVDPLPPLLAIKSLFQLLAHFLGRFASHRKLDQAPQCRRPRRLGFGGYSRPVHRSELLAGGRRQITRQKVFRVIEQRRHQRHANAQMPDLAGARQMGKHAGAMAPWCRPGALARVPRGRREPLVQ